MDRRRHAVNALLVVTWLTSSAHAKEPATPPPADASPEDAKGAREHGLVLTDGKGHYIAFTAQEPATRDPSTRPKMFYGDGTTFYAVFVKGYATDDEKVVTWAILDYRVGLDLDRSKLVRANGAYTMTCRDATSVTSLTPLAGADARKLLANASFKVARMDREAYALGRDGTTYYFVDRAMHPKGNTDFRVYVGKRGAMKKLRLADVATDSSGTVLSSKTGVLRVGKPLSLTWAVKPSKPVALTVLPVDDNFELAYSDLGVYTGKRFGLPCDDM